MSDWDELVFSDAFVINPKVPLIRSKDYPFVDMQSLDSGSRSVESNQMREYSGGGSKFQHRDVLLARITPCLENGKIARYWNLSKNDAHGSTEFIVIRGRPGITDTDFAFYVVRSPQVHQYAISQMTGTSGRQRVPTDAFDHLTIPIPDLDEQRAIAHILGTLDDKIELNRRMNEALEGIARALFKSWFIDFDPVRAKAEGRQPFGMDQETAALFPDQFEDSELGEIPKGWEIQKIGDILELAYGKPLKDEDREGGNIPVYGSNGIVGWHSSELVKGPGIIVGRKGNPGSVNWSTVDFYPIDTTFYVVPKGALPLPFLYQLLANQDLASLSADSAVPGLNRNHAYQNPVIIPDSTIARKFVDIYSTLLDKCHCLSSEIDILVILRDNLLPKLISGDIRIDPSKFGFGPEGEKVGEV